MPQLATCKYCFADISWFITKNSKFIPVQPDSVDWKYVEYVDGHPLYGVGQQEPHFPHCTRKKRSKPPPNYKKWHTSEDFKSWAPSSNAQVGAYAILQVVPTAHESVLRAAHRALTLLYHPDRAGDSSHEKMLELNQAWETIKKERKL